MNSNLDVDTIEFRISLTNGLSASEPLGLMGSGHEARPGVDPAAGRTALSSARSVGATVTARDRL